MKIAIVDDHNIIIEGIELLLSSDKDINIVKTYNDGNLLLNELRNNSINVGLILLDLYMPTINGLEISKIIKKDFPNIKIIILSMNCEENTINDLIEIIGVEGYLSKKIDRQELRRAIKTVNDGGVYLSSEADVSLTKFKKKIISYPTVKLSLREKDIVRLLIDGSTNREVANKLHISESTVETHRKNIYRKTETHSLPKLIQLVADLKLLEDL